MGKDLYLHFSNEGTKAQRKKSHLPELPSCLVAEQLKPNLLIPSLGVLGHSSSKSFPLPLPGLTLPRFKVRSFPSRAFPPQSQCWIPLSDPASFPALDQGPAEQLGTQG